MIGRSILAAALSLSLSMPAAAATGKKAPPEDRELEETTYVVTTPDGTEEGPAKPPKVDPANRKLVVAGNITTGLGGAALVVMLVGLLIHQNQPSSGGGDPDDPTAELEDSGSLGVGGGLAIGGGAAAGALFVSGITLMAVGYRREKQRRAKLNLTLRPAGGPGEFGLAGRIRF